MCSSGSRFSDIGVLPYLCRGLENANWIHPTTVQQLAIPQSLQGKDVIGLAETGSGKTGAFLIPIIQHWILAGRPHGFSLVLVPTRELAQQIVDVAVKLGSSNDNIPEESLVAVQVIGGESLVDQAMRLAWNRHHIIVATPGRLVEHITQSRDFCRQQLSTIRHLVLDEADRMLNMAFADDIDVILGMFRPPKSRKRRRNPKRLLSLDGSTAHKKPPVLDGVTEKFPHPQTYLYSATMTKDVLQLKRVALSTDAVVINTNEVGSASEFRSKNDAMRTLFPSTLWHFYLPLRMVDKPATLLWVLQASTFAEARVFCKLSSSSNQNEQPKAIIFCQRCQEALLVAQFLTEAGCSTVFPLTGQMSHVDRKQGLQKFCSTKNSILVATDIASRGLDVPDVSLVVNYSVPLTEKVYRHRVGRTARTGCFGIALTFVTRECASQFLDLESVLLPYMIRSGQPNSGEEKIQRWPIPIPPAAGMCILRRRAETAWRKASKFIRTQTTATNYLSSSDEDSHASGSSAVDSTSDSDADFSMVDEVVQPKVDFTELGKSKIPRLDTTGSAGMVAAKRARKLEKKQNRIRRQTKQSLTGESRTGWGLIADFGESNTSGVPVEEDQVEDNLRFSESVKMKYLETKH